MSQASWNLFEQVCNLQFKFAQASCPALVFILACTKTRNGETKALKRNHRNERNDQNETSASETTETTEMKPPKRNCRNEKNHQNETAKTPKARKFPNQELGATTKLCCYRFGECGDLEMA